jgi:hypothetical protein
LIVCEAEFEDPDPENPDYSFTEIDFYGWIPPDSGFPNHRLSLRKNLRTGEYEVYRAYSAPKLIARGGVIIITDEPLGKEEVVFRSKSLKEALEFARAEVIRFHGDSEEFEVCTHRYPKRSSYCKVKDF